MTNIDQGDDRNICVRCGMCCSGVLFNRATIADAEVDMMTTVGLELLATPDGPSLKFPCNALNACRCTIYDSRPAVCSEYRCTTLQALDADEITVAEALKRIALTRDAVARLDAALQRGESVCSCRQRLRRELAASVPGASDPMLRFRLGTLEILLDRYFRDAPRQIMRPPQPEAPPDAA